MAHLWIADDGEPAWAVLELDAHAYDLTAWPPARIADGGDDHDAVLHPSGDAERPEWVVLAACSVRVTVNGLPLQAGVRVLQDRDEIRVGANCAYFSTERLPRVETFAGADRPLSCPRCLRPIVAAADAAPPVVRCPGCGALYHESPERNCWTHGQTCSLCPQPTRLDSGYRWTPEDL